MTKDNWEEIYNELYYLREEFCQKYRQNINDLKYQTKVKENENRVAQIINNFIVSIVICFTFANIIRT
jgi:hypothetical protein